MTPLEQIDNLIEQAYALKKLINETDVDYGGSYMSNAAYQVSKVINSLERVKAMHMRDDYIAKVRQN